MRRGKFPDVGDAVGYLAADCIVVFERNTGGDVYLDIFYNTSEFIERFGRLRIKPDVFGEIQSLSLFQFFNDDGFSVGLPNKSKHFGMSVLAVDDDLFVTAFLCHEFLLDSFLQLEDYGAGCINDFDIVASGYFVCLGWLTVGTKQYFGIFQLSEFLVVDGCQSHVFQPFYFAAVVHDVAQAIKSSSIGQFFFGFADGGYYSEAESGSFIYFYFHHIFVLLSACSSFGNPFELFLQPFFLLCQ